VKGVKALGNQLTNKEVKEINLLDPITYEPKIVESNEIESIDEYEDIVVDNVTDANDDSPENNQIELDF